MELIKSIGLGALAVLVVGWLAVSFLPAGRRRAGIEWVAATAAFAALASFFLSLVLHAWAEGSILPLIAFGLLGAVFTSGFFVSLFKTISAIRGRGGSAGPSATH